jgi:hypothetical protein
MVSQEIAEDSKLAQCSDEAALTYAFTLPFLDRDGLCSGKPSWIAGRALQERPHLQHKAGIYIQEWVTVGLVIRYQGSDGPVLFFPGFRKHNANMPYEKEQRSKFPPPPGYHRDEDKNGVCHGLIPDDPEAAGRLAEVFDARSLYHKALTEATTPSMTLAQSLGLEDTPKTDLHKEVPTYSRPTPDLVPTSSRPTPDEVGTKRTEVEDQQKLNRTEVEENNNNVLRELCAHESTAVGVVGVDAVLSEMDDGQVMALLTWCWLWNGWSQDNGYHVEGFKSYYKSDPFQGMKNPVAVMLANARKGSPAPLHPDHLADVRYALKQAAS